MATQKGHIGITTENIFPVIKKFLYSDHEIFLREIVANAVDATQKLRTLASKGEFKGDTTDVKVSVSIDKEAGTLTISDQGIGMTAEEIDRYINQIAFSGATDFLEKYKDDAATIIGHFGLGFYSSFMVSSRVDIVTKSYREGAEAVNGVAMALPSSRSNQRKRQNAVQTLCCTSTRKTRNSSKRVASKRYSINTAASSPSPLPLARRRSGKMDNRWTPQRTT